MTTAGDIIRGGLRLINVPGRGALLSQDDWADGLTQLQDILSSASVSKFFQPGVRRHFFELVQAKHAYTYGPGGDFDTRRFGDPTPIAIEDVYIRQNGGITDREAVTNGAFTTATDWVLGAGWSILNGILRVATGGTTTASQTLTLSPGTTYTVKVSVAHRASSVSMEVRQDATAIITRVLDSNGGFSFDFTPSGGTSWSIIFTANATSDLDIDDVSIIPAGQDRLELRAGTDYRIRCVDQRVYNDQFVKGETGRPYELFWNRRYPLSDLRLDNAGLVGDILVMDVLVNSTAVTRTSDEVKLWPEAMKWLKYRLAYEMAPSYGKVVSLQHKEILRDAYNDMTAGNIRINMLRPDRALRPRTTYDIDRGEP